MKSVLFTNLDYVILNEVRTYCHGLVLQSDRSLFNHNKLEHKVRGFGTEAAWPVFDMKVESVEYQISRAAGADVFFAGDSAPRPLFSGAILELKDGPKITLLDCDHRRPIDVHEFPEGTDYEDVWVMLQRKADDYWTAPNMPRLSWAAPVSLSYPKWTSTPR